MNPQEKTLAQTLRTLEGVQGFVAWVLSELCDSSPTPRFTNERLKSMIYGAKTLADMIASSKVSKMTDEEIIALFRARFASQISQRDGKPAAPGAH